MYESGVSKTARVLVVIMAILLGLLFIISGCAPADAAEQEVVVETSTGSQHHFF